MVGMVGLCSAMGCTVDSNTVGTSFGTTGEPPGTSTTTPDLSTTGGAASSGGSTAAADSTGPGDSEDSSTSSSSTTGCAERLVVFADADEDGFGDPKTATETCEALVGFVEDDTDCDDTLDTVNPSVAELCDGIDNDCDGVLDEFSADNVACDGCTLAERDTSVYWLCEGPVNRFAARARCLDYGGDLISILDLPEDSFVRGIVVGPRDWFIGLEDLAQEGDYVWSDGSEPNYFGWAVGEPNNVDDENCAELALEDSWGWNDTNCDNEQDFICEATPAPGSKR